MPTFRVTQVEPCWVTWTYRVEADNLEHAEERCFAGEGELEGEGEIGDRVESQDSEWESEEIDPETGMAIGTDDETDDEPVETNSSDDLI